MICFVGHLADCAKRLSTQQGGYVRTTNLYYYYYYYDFCLIWQKKY